MLFHAILPGVQVEHRYLGVEECGLGWDIVTALPHRRWHALCLPQYPVLLYKVTLYKVTHHLLIAATQTSF